MGSSRRTLSFASISGRKVEADFDGGTTTSDAGALLLRQAESNIGIIDRVVAAMSDRRHPSYVDHTYTDLIRQRVFQIACGYEDANDSNDLRSDPGFKAACGRLPLSGADLASQPTMSRLENSVSRTDLYRIGLALLEGFIESYDQPPKKIILDIDDMTLPTVHSSCRCSTPTTTSIATCPSISTKAPRANGSRRFFDPGAECGAPKPPRSSNACWII